MVKGVRFSNNPAAIMAKRLNDAVREVEGQRSIWTASHLFGEIDIDFTSKVDVKAASAAFQEGTEYAISVVSDAVQTALDAAVSSSAWAWSSGGARDIVDTGELKNSLTVTASGNDIFIEYGAPYAAFVHEGGYIRPYGNTSVDTVYIPGRPWVDAVLLGNGPVPSVDLDKIIGDAIDSEIR